MATGYVVSGRGDLDALFKARSSTAGANTGYKSNGGVDLAQRFELRGSSTAIAATGYKAGAVDLASIFMDIAYVPSDRTLGAGSTSTFIGYQDATMGVAAYGSLSNTAWASSLITQINRDTAGSFWVGMARTSAAPPDDNTAWTDLKITGVFSDSSGATVTRTLVRSARGTTNVNGPVSGYYERRWLFGSTLVQFINGNAYGLLFT